MNKFFCRFLLLPVFLVFIAGHLFAQDKIGAKDEKISYSFGMVVASDLVDAGLQFDYEAFMQGFRATMENEKTDYTMDEALEAVEATFQLVQENYYESLRVQGEKNLAEGMAFLEENRQRTGVEVTPSGLQFELISEGSGEMPGPGDTVLAHYSGATIDGEVFDSSYERGEPLEVPLYRVIPGWSEGLRMMREGGKAKLYIPPDLAYGEDGARGFIGPNTVLIFEVELISILREQEEE